MGETATHLGVIWDPAHFSTGPCIPRAETRGEGAGSLLVPPALAWQLQQRRALREQRPAPAPPVGDPHHVSMGAGTHRFLQGLEVPTLLERLRRQKCSHNKQWIRGCSDWQKMYTARVPEVHVTFNKLMGMRNTKPHLRRFGFFCKIAHLI